MHFGDVALFEKHEATGHGQQRSNIRGYEVFAFAEADDDRATLACEDDALPVRFADHGERIRAFEFGHRGPHRLEQIVGGLKVVVDTVRDDLGVRIGGEFVTCCA